MQLDEFVSEVLQQIVKGVSSAQAEVKTLGARVNPTQPSSYGGKGAWDANIHPEKERAHGVNLNDHDSGMLWEVTKSLARQLLASVNAPGKTP